MKKRNDHKSTKKNSSLFCCDMSQISECDHEPVLTKCISCYIQDGVNDVACLECGETHDELAKEIETDAKMLTIQNRS